MFSTLTTFLRRVQLDRRLRREHRSIRTTDPQLLSERYTELSPDEFAELNGAQRWLDHKLIPRALRQFVHPGPWRMVDLGCGEGDSTAVLLEHAPPGSTVIGYDLAEPLIERARARRWPTHRGASAAQFVVQSVLATLRAPSGRRLPRRSIHVAHAAGFVGHHLDHEAASTLLSELVRILAPTGIAILDSGPKLHPNELTRLAAEHGLRRAGIARLLPWQVRAALTFEHAI